jgi:hypothetical protein
VLVAVGAGFAVYAYATDQPYAYNLTCEALAERIIPTFADQAIHPVRVFNVQPGALQGEALTCSADGWFSNGIETPIWFTWTRADGQEYLSYGVRLP